MAWTFWKRCADDNDDLESTTLAAKDAERCIFLTTTRHFYRGPPATIPDASTHTASLCKNAFSMAYRWNCITTAGKSGRSIIGEEPFCAMCAFGWAVNPTQRQFRYRMPV